MSNREVAPILGVNEVVGAVQYFVESLGASPPDHFYGPPEERVYAIVGRHSVSVHLQIRRGRSDPGPRQAHEGEIHFFVPNAGSHRDEFAAKGVQISSDLQDEPYGVRDFTIETPFGFRLTFGTRTP